MFSNVHDIDFKSPDDCILCYIYIIYFKYFMKAVLLQLGGGKPRNYFS